MTELGNMGQIFSSGSLDKANFSADPLIQFQLWFDQAQQHSKTTANVMTLATADEQAKPSARIVLLKQYDNQGFVFYTNYQSHKANHLEANPQAACVFWWPECERQVRIEGKVSKLTATENQKYFQSRPRASQIAATASPQSHEIHSRQALFERYQAVEKDASQEALLACPAYWGGFRIQPDRIEFWQGGADRLHDRLVYSLKEASWCLSRLAP